jgi:uncharacterized membrane protein
MTHTHYFPLAAGVRGGAVIPIFSLLASCVALAVSGRFATPIAYVGGRFGVLIGADLRRLAGGAEAFEGTFLISAIAVLLTSRFMDRR